MSDELINSAVTFLLDPKVADAPLAKRIAFLESKGLSSDQVQTALQRAQEAPPAPSSSSQAAANNISYAPSRPVASYSTYQQQAPPPLPQRDWRDWFIMAVVSGGFSWAVYFLAKRYVIPLMSPPTSTQLETDKESISAQFDQVQEMLSILQKETEEIKAYGSDQNKKVETALSSVDEAVQEMKTKTERRENDIRRLGLEMDQLRELLPKAIDSVKTAQNDALADLNGELRSLKTLLQNRIKATSGGSPFTNTSTNTSNEPPSASSSGSKAPAAPSATSTTGAAGGSVGQVAQAQASTNGKTTVSDPLARFTARAGNGIPEWQKSAPGPSAAGSVDATASNVENNDATT
ncbi:putative Peroxisomal membrane anchor protein [Taphrina deformans PYCC 5710]|uniref:Peroxisomal membrane protein PEX14 n=1 Tax=Taphrina deformans (strain PYCC 5710 / ATCC 11124 / CBS 356.35 / IMI 108563 / JCM 9778 / NBRC 8474) TaxID=1097556 RepID=R4X9V7_TAPDE|nr:putative Peroxisomal membrane anchor protein [Taphrina deformans PYCC 5710]|eukprot:CCG82272.1 putative Peroxisomal membrane anchor protein [Taphrina deformans PYCC 5710]